MSENSSRIDADSENPAGRPSAPFAEPGAARAVKRRRACGIAALVVVLAVVAINHREVTALRDRFIPKRWGVVEPGMIFRSGQLSRHLVRQMLETHGIRRVVDLTFDNPDDANHSAELAAISDMGIERRLRPLEADGTGDVHIYAQAVADVAEAERQGKPVLVHCYAGAQRTGGVVALYRLLVEHKEPAAVLEEMAKYKYDRRRSPRLVNYLNEHIGEIAADLVRNGTISRVPDPLPRFDAE